MLRKSGVQEWQSPDTRQAIQQAAVEMAAFIWINSESCPMPNKILIQEQDGTPKQIVFGDHAGDFSPAAGVDLRDATSGNRTTCQLSLASVADGAARQSAKVDLGENRAPAYIVRAAIEIAATPTAGDVIELYWAPSQSSTAATANPGGVSGSDAAYAGYSANLAAAVKQLQLIGHVVCTTQATGTVQQAIVGILEPDCRYGSLVVKNESGAALHSDDVDSHVVFDPICPEIQT